MMSDDATTQAVEVAKRWIRSKGCTLWMDWDVSTEDGLQAAAEWLVKTMDTFVDFYESEMVEKSGW